MANDEAARRKLTLAGEQPGALTRREMVRAAAAVACTPALAALAGCARQIPPSRDLAGTCPANGILTVPLAQAPELRQSGGSVVVRPTPDSLHLNPVLVANVGAGYVALSAICPHASCEVTWVAEDREVECPCHGSRFASDGTLLHPPALTGLPAYPAALNQAGDAVAVRLFAGDGALPPVIDGKITIDLAQFPRLQPVGGIVIGHPEGIRTPLVVLRKDSSTFVALGAACTHLGCTVAPDGAPATGFVCPCHGSHYQLDGKVLPAQLAQFDLPSYDVSFTDGQHVVIAVPALQCP